MSEQDYPGPVRVVVVYDNTPPDWRLARGGDRPVLVLENWRTPGVAGARNTGILAVADCELVAFCEDDDVWLPGKLTAQVTALRHRPGALFVTCAAEIEYAGRYTALLTRRREVGPSALTRARVAGLTASGFVARQQALATHQARGGIGLLAEDAPPEAGPWDLLLRAAAVEPILHVDTPLVRILWRPAPQLLDEAAEEIRLLRWMLRRHPQLSQRRPAAARVYAEIACWEAAGGQRRAAREAARNALRTRWYHPYALAAGLAAAGLLRGRTLRAGLHRRRLP